MPLISPSSLDAIRYFWSDTFNTSLQDKSGDLWSWTQIAERVDMPTEVMNLPISDFPPAMVPWTGGRPLSSLAQYNTQLSAIHYVNGITINRDRFLDSQGSPAGWAVANYTRSVDNLAKIARRAMNANAAIALYTSTTGFDGVSIFNDSHPVDPSDASKLSTISGSATWDNLFASTSLTWDNVWTVRQNSNKVVGFDGLPLGIDYDTLIVPASLRALATTICMADKVPFGTIHGGTPVAETYNTLKGLNLIVIPELEVNSSTTWYMMDSRFKPMVMGVAKEPAVDFSQMSDQAPAAFTHNEYRVGADGRWAARLVLPHGVCKCTA